MKAATFRTTILIALIAASGASSALARQTFVSSVDPLPAFLGDYDIRYIGPENGLPASYIRRLVRGRDGQLYAVTYRGVVRLFAGYAEPVELPGYDYDGIEFFDESPTGDQWVLSQNGKLGVVREGGTIEYPRRLTRFTDPIFGSDGSLWMTGTGITRFTVSSDAIQEHETRIPDSLQTGVISHVIEMEGLGIVAVGQQRAVVLSPGAVRPIGPEFRLSGHRNDIIVQQNSFWIPTVDGLLRIGSDGFDAHLPGSVTWSQTGWGREGSRTEIDSTLARMLRFPELTIEESRRIIRGFAASDGSVWLALSAPEYGHPRLMRIYAGRAAVIPLDEKAEFSEINSFMEDHEGSIWVRTDRGLIQLAPRPVQALTMDHGLRESFTTGLLETLDGRVMVGTWGAGVHVFFNGSLERVLSAKDGLPDDHIRTLFEDRNGRIWIGSRNGAAYLESDGIHTVDIPYPVRSVRAFVEDEKGCLWIVSDARLGCYKDDILIPAGTRSTQQRSIWDAEALPDGRILLATETGLFVTSQPDAEGIPQALEPMELPDSDDLSWVVMIHRLSDGSLWLSTYNDGLFRLDTDPIVHIDESDGLHSPGIWAMVEDDAGNVWMSSDHGVGMVALQDLVRLTGERASGVMDTRLRTLVFRESEGLPSRESNRSSSGGIRLGDGRLLFNNLKGLVVVDPERAVRTNPPPRLLLSEFQADGEPERSEQGRFIVEPGTQQIKVTVSALSYIAPSQTTYRHRIDGYEADWRFDGPSRTITYTGLPPGSHDLLMQASVGGGAWTPDPLMVSLDVRPRLWERTTFRWGLPFLALFVVAMLFRMQARRQNTLERIVGERTSQLRREKEKTALQAEQLRSKATRLARLDRTRSRFFANISHEIRTPLTNVSLVLDHLSTGTDADGPLLETARLNVDRLTRLSEDIVVLSRVDCGELEFRPLGGDIRASINRIVLSHAPLAELHSIRLNTRFEGVSEGESVSAEFDEKLLGHLVGNFISNGIKFSSAGGKVQVRLDVHDTYLEIHVSDTGTGIDEKDLHHLFDRFYQSDDSIARIHEGMGLGLAVVKEVSERVRGTLRVESTPGMGSTFTIRLPRWYPAERARAFETPSVGSEEGRAEPDDVLGEPGVVPNNGEQAESSTPVQGQGHVLIVEDNRDTNRLLSDILSKAGFHPVRSVHSAGKAMEAIREAPPDAVVTDVMMPDEDGLSMIERIRSESGMEDLPVLVVSARSGPEFRKEAFERGADAYLEKPFDEAELVSLLVRQIHTRDALRKRYSNRLVLADTSQVIPSSEERFVRDVRTVILEELATISVDDLADHMACSPQHLRRKLKAATGYSPARFIREIRLDEARLRLEAGADHVQQIALSVGYRDLASLRKHFKSRFGVLPSEIERVTD